MKGKNDLQQLSLDAATTSGDFRKFLMFRSCRHRPIFKIVPVPHVSVHNS